MAGHSHSKNIMHRKGAQDAKKAKVFNKIAREITVACKVGAPDPAANPRLRAAIAEARANNMPRERIERAIKAALPGADASNYETVRYEGYGPGGVALIVEALTDNRTRTVADVRTAFSKHGGALGESNSVSFMFTQVGQIIYPAAAAGADAMLEAVIEAGGENVESDAELHDVTTSVDDFGPARAVLEEKFGEPSSVKLIWKPLNLVAISGDAAADLLKLLDVLEDNDDVQTVYGNFDIAAEDLEKLAG
ncbi:MAG: YebC/PmpR family DNA-binding transcriptional regulator [Alphaproteobacteria bacterium]|nr:YebC/PmpR family DNA-binding transcriptional regulator [Alphaproteobacteria bacterium]